MQKKKIAIVGPAYPYRGGNSLFIAYLYDKLSEQFDVTILNYTLLYPSFLFPGTTQFDQSSVTLKPTKSERIVNSISPVSWLKTAKRIKEINPDLVVFDWWHPFFSFCHFSISFFLGKKFQKKILSITENFISPFKRRKFSSFFFSISVQKDKAESIETFVAIFVSVSLKENLGNETSSPE